jgi:hypothetical protein
MLLTHLCCLYLCLSLCRFLFAGDMSRRFFYLICPQIYYSPASCQSLSSPLFLPLSSSLYYCLRTLHSFSFSLSFLVSYSPPSCVSVIAITISRCRCILRMRDLVCSIQIQSPCYLPRTLKLDERDNVVVRVSIRLNFDFESYAYRQF